MYSSDEDCGVVAGGRVGPRRGGGRGKLFGGTEAAHLPRQGAAQEEPGKQEFRN